MTHRAVPNRFRFALLAALAVAVPAAPSATSAQTKTKTATTPQAFTAGLKAAKTQADALSKQGKDKFEKAKKQHADAQATVAKLQGGEQTDAVKQQIAQVQAQLDALKQTVDKLEKVAQKTQEILPKLEAALQREPCSSETKGVKLALAPVKLDADSIVGSATSEIAKTREAEKAAAVPKVKAVLTTYAGDIQSLAKLASALSAAVGKLEEQAATLPACP